MTTQQEFVETILDYQERPRNRRRIAAADIQATGGNPSCGDVVVIFAKLNDRGRVVDASFEGEGCSVSLAAASMLTEDLLGKNVEDIGEMTFRDVAARMGMGVVATRARCATLALSTARRAVDDYMRSQSDGVAGTGSTASDNAIGYISSKKIL